MSTFLTPRAGSSRHRQSASPLNTATGQVPSNDHRRSLSSSVANQISLRGVRRLETRRAMEENHFNAQRARSQTLNPPIDYRQLDYVTETDENLVCAICKCPFVDPVVLPDCDHCFCRDCIRQSWPTLHPLGPRGDCPTCRTPGKLGARSATSKIIVNILDDLEVFCPKHHDGCTTKLKRSEVQDHITLYCGYGMVECPGDDCDLPLLRKDLPEACLHYGVCCIDCRQSMLKSALEQHWKQACPDRKVHCSLCKLDINYRDIQEHNKQTCPAISVACPGHEYGCTKRFKRAQANAHARECPLAKLGPFLTAQKQRLDEHEVAQRQMSHKLEVLERGLANMQSLLRDPVDDPDSASADETRIPLLHNYHRRADSFATARTNILEDDLSMPTSPIGSQRTPRRLSAESRGRRSQHQQFDAFPDFDDHSLPPATEHGPYTSPIDHLLSIHESLRNEVMRIATAVQELDGRHSMQTLNENLRTREELAYLTGQMAGMSRQVHWLTSAQLQNQQGRGTTSSGRGGDFSEMPSAGSGVEAAVNAVSSAASALRGAARIVSGTDSSDGVGTREGATRRRLSDEGRTKL